MVSGRIISYLSGRLGAALRLNECAQLGLVEHWHPADAPLAMRAARLCARMLLPCYDPNTEPYPTWAPGWGALDVPPTCRWDEVLDVIEGEDIEI